MKVSIEVLLYSIINIYTIWQLEYWLKYSFANYRELKIRYLLMTVYLCLASIPAFGAFLPDNSAKFLLQGLGNIWLGYFLFMFAFFLILHLIRIVRIRLIHDEYTQNIHAARVTLALVIGVSAIINVYGFFHARDTVYSRYDINIEKHSEETANLKIVLVSDLHLGVNSDIRMTEHTVEMINHEHPDVVIVAGDILSSSYSGLKNPNQYSKILSKINSKYGVFAVYGNHDVEETLFGGFAVSPPSKALHTKNIRDFMKKSGFRMLEDDTVSIAGNINLIGRIDLEKPGHKDTNRKSVNTLLSEVNDSDPNIVIEHEPVDLKEFGKSSADIVLSGHTHDGQVFPGTLLLKALAENNHGLKEFGSTKSIVSAGVGFYGPPIRVGCNSEITVIDVHFTK